MTQDYCDICGKEIDRSGQLWISDGEDNPEGDGEEFDLCERHRKKILTELCKKERGAHGKD